MTKYPPHVMVQFNDGAHSFLLTAGATLMELADRIDALAAIHNCAPTATDVDFDKFDSRELIPNGSHRAYSLTELRPRNEKLDEYRVKGARKGIGPLPPSEAVDRIHIPLTNGEFSCLQMSEWSIAPCASLLGLCSSLLLSASSERPIKQLGAGSALSCSLQALLAGALSTHS